MKPSTPNNTHPSEQGTEDRESSPPTTKPTNDNPLLPHAATSALSAASNVASDVAASVKTAVGDAVAWTEAKVEKLSAKEEDGTGPYGSLPTCAPSDMDPIAQGVLPGLPVEKGNEGHKDEEKKSEGGEEE